MGPFAWKITVTCFILITYLSQLRCEGENESYVEYEGYDGWYNNLIAPDWGAIDSHLLRRLPVAYVDSVYEPSGQDRPNPINISDAFMAGEIGLSSYRGRTALLVFFGQQVVEEILDAQRPGCPPEYFNIDIPKGHPQYDREGRGGYQIPLLRTRYDQNTGYSPNNPRQQLNEITPYIDGNLVYGASKAWADTLRAFEDGLMAADEEKHKEDTVYNTFPIVNTIRLPMANPPTPYYHELRKVSRHFRLGNPRGNENPFLLTWGIVWFRYHNWWAKKLKAEHSDWEDEKLFNEARKWVIAVYQKLVVYDWLPAWVQRDSDDADKCSDVDVQDSTSNSSSSNNGTRDYRPLGKYEGYNPYIHPGIAQEFQSAAMRFGHTLVPPGVLRRNGNCDYRMTGYQSDLGSGDQPFHGLRTCNTFWLSRETYTDLNTDIDEVLMGMASQVTEREDNIITPDLRGFVFGGLEFSRRDLMAVNIQRGRDHGLPDYNTAREFYGLKRITKFEDINPYHRDRNGNDSVEFMKSLKALEDVYHGDIDKLDIWPGGLAETTPCGPGGLFSSIIIDQFRRIRDGDRFWFENYQLNGLFTAKEVEMIWDITLKDILVQVTGVRSSDIQDNPFFIDGAQCLPAPELNANTLENCTDFKTFDYFSGSEVSYALSFTCLGLAAVGIVLLMVFLARRRQAKIRMKSKSDREKRQASMSNQDNVLNAVEWVGPKDGRRQIKVKLHERRKSIEIVSAVGSDEKKLRMIDLNMTKKLFFHIAVNDMRFLVIKVPKEYDLALKFDAPSQRSYFIDKLEAFLRSCEVPRERVELPEKTIRKATVTKRDRQQRLEKFFKVVFAQAFSLSGDMSEVSKLNSEEAKDIVSTELSRVEFSEALSMKPNSLFVNNLFPLLDKNNDGYVSFREFLDLMVVFSKGSPDDKARLLFEMYDINKSGRLSRIEFTDMLRSLLELANSEIDSSQLNQLMDSMAANAGLGNKDRLQFEDFSKILNNDNDLLNYARLGWKVGGQEKMPDNIPNRARQTFHRAYSANEDRNKTINRVRVAVRTEQRQFPQTKQQRYWYIVERYIANYKREIFWVSLFTLVTFGIFIERAYYYSFEREHAGLRTIAGNGVTVTRGAASVMMWTYSVMLLTMCRNLITFLRETFFHRFIPFDGAIAFHKYIAFWALVFTVVHCIGHAINFYHVSTQTANDLTCLFRDFFHATHELPKFHYWLYGTITGMTGVLLTIQVIVIYTFATQYARRSLFMAFWFTHSTYIVFYVFMVMHGSGRLVQPPLFQNFFLGPILVYTLDKMVSFSRKKVEIPVLKAEHLPSDVLCLVFRRPQNFEYRSGQWVRIACLKLGSSEYHPFTLTSAPHEENLSLHIRAVGPWTNNLRKVYNPANKTIEKPFPKIYLDGPYGEGHQDWYKFPVAVLVGGGIGVTPFASILKDIVFKSKTGFKFPCRKVYFLWVTRTQKHFEWLTDIIREVEEADDRKLVSVHIFITQFFQKFDMRTTLLYVCERHFQKISGKSLFTGLQSITHFGRPNFTTFLDSLQDEHPGVHQVGVFSCGPPPMTNDVDRACSNLNKIEGPTFSHHFENF